MQPHLADRVDHQDSAGDERPYLTPYREAVARLGGGFEALLYYNRDTQHRRFEALAKLAPLEGRRVVDVGCGHADLLTWLEQQGVVCAEYLGLDAMPAFVTVAQAKVAHAATTDAECRLCDFVACDFGELMDARPTTFVFSGSLNALAPAVARERLRSAFRVLSVRRGNALVFNFLSRCASYDGVEDAHLRRFEATEMLAFALEQTPLVVFSQHYLSGHDATISMLVP